MSTLKLFWQTIVQLPGTIVNACQPRRPARPQTPREIEAERIDRIRFPSKYRGK